MVGIEMQKRIGLAKNFGNYGLKPFMFCIILPHHKWWG